MAMRTSAYVLASLVYTGHGQQMQLEQAHRRTAPRLAIVGHWFSLAVTSHSSRPASARGALHPLEALALLLLSHDPLAAFHSEPYSASIRHLLLNFAGRGHADSKRIVDMQVPEAEEDRMERLEGLKLAASSGVPFNDQELESAVSSLRNAAGKYQEALDWISLRSFLAASAHEPYKDWSKTEDDAKSLSAAFLDPSSAEFRHIFQRVLKDGCWDSALKAASERAAGYKPWIVLVTGLNGIRKTTCMYQPWFKKVLHDAITSTAGEVPTEEELPDGNDSFFRQLDHIIATIANEEFRTLYLLTDVDRYSAMKDGIFARYRRIAEMWGILLVKEAQAKQLNVMVETSGRDPGMFYYIDHMFPDDSYRKLVLHFEINNITFAERSVDSRMMREMAAGQSALAGTVEELIKVNAGGPYGSKVLLDVQTDSNRIWKEEVMGGNIASSWYKASISITAQEGAEWTAGASMAPPDAEVFPIERLS